MIDKPDLEIEYKFEVKSKDGTVSLLDKKGEKISERQYQSSVMFDNPSELMQITDGRVRVRTLGESGIKELTYKKPLPPQNGAKREIEYEIEFTDTSEQIEKILGAMEFTPSTSYERYRTVWKIDDVHVTLDEYPHANYLEIEGKQDDIEKVVKILGFDLNKALIKPADTLFQEWRKSKGLTFKPHMRFDDYDK